MTVALGPNGDKGLLIDLPGTDEPTVEWLRGILAAAHQQPSLIVFVCDGRTLFSDVNDADQALDALSFPEATMPGWFGGLFNPRARLGAESVFSVGTECTWTERRCRLESAHEHGYDSDSLEVALSLLK